jgi:deoxyribose-phosphate aldolase
MLTKEKPVNTVFCMKVSSFSKLFDHSIVRPDATKDEVLRFAETAVRLNTATLTVQPYYIRFATDLLNHSNVLLGSVVGFPHGNETPSMKEYQTKAALDLGAQEIDMVMNIPALKNNDKSLFFADVEGVITAGEGITVKVITENCFLTHEEKQRACYWISQTGAHFVKTSTAYADGGATLDDVRLMYEAVDGRCQVKAAGGIRKIEEILEYLRAGARRFGSTRTDQLMQAFRGMPEGKREGFSEFLIDLGV